MKSVTQRDKVLTDSAPSLPPSPDHRQSDLLETQAEHTLPCLGHRSRPLLSGGKTEGYLWGLGPHSLSRDFVRISENTPSSHLLPLTPCSRPQPGKSALHSSSVPRPGPGQAPLLQNLVVLFLPFLVFAWPFSG